MSTLLAKNLLRFGVKNLTESKMINYLKEQVDADAIMAWLQGQQAYAETLKRWRKLSQDRTKALLVKSARLEPFAPEAEELKLNYFNNFVTLDGLQRGTKEAALARINEIINKLKDSDEIIITSGASSSPASINVNTNDAANGAPSKIDHTYAGNGTDKAKFDKWNASLKGKGGLAQKGNEYLAKMRGENVKAYMVQQGIDASKIKVIPKIETEKFMNVQGYVTSDRKIISVTGVSNPTLNIQMTGGWTLITGKWTDYIQQVKNSQEVQNWQTDMKMGNATEADKPEVLKQAEQEAALGQTSDLRLDLTMIITVAIPGKTAVTYKGSIRLGTGTRIAASSSGAKAMQTNYFNTTKTAFINQLRKDNSKYNPKSPYSLTLKQYTAPQNSPAIQDIYKGKGYFTAAGAKSIQNSISYAMASPIMIKLIGDWISGISNSTPIDNTGKIAYMKYANPSADTTGVVAKNNAAIDKALSSKININKSFTIEQMASIGIQGSSPTIQYTAPYWTDALYYDATSQPPRMGTLDDRTITQFFSGVDEFAK